MQVGPTPDTRGQLSGMFKSAEEVSIGFIILRGFRCLVILDHSSSWSTQLDNRIPSQKCFRTRSWRKQKAYAAYTWELRRQERSLIKLEFKSPSWPITASCVEPPRNRNHHLFSTNETINPLTANGWSGQSLRNILSCSQAVTKGITFLGNLNVESIVCLCTPILTTWLNFGKYFSVFYVGQNEVDSYDFYQPLKIHVENVSLRNT